MKQQKKKTDFPFKKEASALAVILFGAIHFRKNVKRKGIRS